MGMRMSRMMASGRTDAGHLEPRFGREGRRHAKPFELEHPRERVGDRPVVVHDQDGSGRGLRASGARWRDHRIILSQKVCTSRSGLLGHSTVSLASFHRRPDPKIAGSHYERDSGYCLVPEVK